MSGDGGRYDLAVVGAGIVGLAHALAAVRLGARVLVLDRDAQANGASIRNFGFVTVTGQGWPDTWRRAARARAVWEDVAPLAGVPVIHRSTVVVARRPEALAVLEQFLAGPMGSGCRLLDPAALAGYLPMACPGAVGGLWSPHELRVEARTAVPALARWLEQAHGVEIRRRVQVHGVAAPWIDSSDGRLAADRIVVCPGPDLTALFPAVLARHRVGLCKLHMLRLAPQPAGWRLPGAVMMDLSLVRYAGYTPLPGVPALRARLEREAPASLGHGIHLIVVQSADGSLVVGDSHHYADTPDPFAPDAVDALILGHLDETLTVPERQVTERWTGIYPIRPDGDVLVEAPDPATRLVLVTSGTGMSTAFALAEEVVAELMA